MKRKPIKRAPAPKKKPTRQSNRKKIPMDNEPIPEFSDASEESEEVLLIETAAITPAPTLSPTPVTPLDSMQQASLSMAAADAAGRLAEQSVANAGSGITQAATGTPPATAPVEGLD